MSIHVYSEFILKMVQREHDNPNLCGHESDSHEKLSNTLHF